jgi:SPP1 family predicted phage head-tail adaptor
MISDFSQHITIKSTDIPPDFGFGDGSADATDKFTTWAAIKELSRESMVRQGLEAETLKYKVTIRYASGRAISRSDKVEWGGELYNIITSPSVIEIDKKKFLQFIIVKQDA